MEQHVRQKSFFGWERGENVFEFPLRKVLIDIPCYSNMSRVLWKKKKRKKKSSQKDVGCLNVVDFDWIRSRLKRP